MTERHVDQMHELRQSVWLDSLSRRLVRSSELVASAGDGAREDPGH